MVFKVNNLVENELLQRQLIERIKHGKKVIFQFSSEQDKLEFLEHTAKLFAKTFGAGGAILGGAIGAAIGGPVGAVAGAVIGGLGGAVVGYSLGIWLANFLWDKIIHKNQVSLQFKEAFSWFGLASNRVIALSPSY